MRLVPGSVSTSSQEAAMPAIASLCAGVASLFRRIDLAPAVHETTIPFVL
jgi:hypothetical protein